MTIDDLLELVKTYNNNEDDLKLIQKAYEYAFLMHSGQINYSMIH